MSNPTSPDTASRNGGGPSLEPEELSDIGDFVDSLVAETKEYITVQRELLAMNAYQRVARSAGGLLSGLLAAVLVFGVLAFCSVALAIWLGTLLHSMALGFLAVGGLYLVVFVAFWSIWRNGMKDRFTLNIINSFYDDKD
jgi:hypothetical protein